MAAMDEASVDMMVFADPPYNLRLDGALFRPNNTAVDGAAPGSSLQNRDTKADQAAHRYYCARK